MLLQAAIVAAALCAFGEALKLPPYIQRCSISSNIEEGSACLKDAANKAIPILAKGDKKYRIPSFEPLEVPMLSLSQGTAQVGLNLTWNPGFFWGLGDSQIASAKMDTKNRHTALDIVIPKFAITGEYTSSGRVLLLPIKGHGPSNMTVTNLRVHYEYDWPTEKGADGKDHAVVVNPKIEITDIGGMYVHFDGLFSEKNLENQMNAFLNENWRELVKELGPGLAEACEEVMRLVFSNIASAVPLDEMFLP